MKKLLIYYHRTIGMSILGLFSLVGCNSKEDAVFYYNLQTKYVQGSVKEQRYLDKAIELDSLYVDALVEKSVSHNKRGQFAIGMKFLNKGVELDPVEHLGYRGFVKLYMLRDYFGALNDFLRLDELTPEFRDAPWGEDIYKVIGLSYLGMKEYKKALSYFKQSIEEVSKDNGEEWVESRTFIYYGVCAMKTQNLDDALQSFNTYIKYNPENPSGYYYKAKVLLDLGHSLDEDVKALLNTALNLANRGFIETSPYFELPYQIYPSDIKQLLP